jgi:hypothetical protein
MRPKFSSKVVFCSGLGSPRAPRDFVSTDHKRYVTIVPTQYTMYMYLSTIQKQRTIQLISMF